MGAGARPPLSIQECGSHLIQVKRLAIGTVYHLVTLQICGDSMPVICVEHCGYSIQAGSFELVGTGRFIA